MGPGPSSVHPSTLRAMAAPEIGHLDPRFLRIMDQTLDLLRQVFQTQNQLTLPLSGTGSAGMEAAVVNFVRPGDRVVVGLNGYFGQRLAEMARRQGAEVVGVETEWGRPVETADLRKALAGGPTRLVALVHAETSTGVLQPLEEAADAAHRAGAMLLADAVTSLGGVPVAVDARGVDIAYAGTQKCLSCPPGLAPLTCNDRARQAVEDRAGDPPSWYLDLKLVARYWGEERFYHHTAPINMIYALNQALRLVVEEGLEARFERHRQVARGLWAGLEAMELRLVVPEDQRTPSLTTVWIPEGIDDAAVRRRLLAVHGIEIGGALGPWKGRAWRIGTMGESARPQNVYRFLAALGECLGRFGHPVGVREALAAAREAMAALEG
ncbi:pyridoxal-phosphate-dependent aminotransferase family protein [Limnochorda pilosa]